MRQNCRFSFYRISCFLCLWNWSVFFFWRKHIVRRFWEYNIKENIWIRDRGIKRITSIHQPTNAHIISHKTLLKHFNPMKCFKSVLCEIICAFVGWWIEVILQKMHSATIRFEARGYYSTVKMRRRKRFPLHAGR